MWLKATLAKWLTRASEHTIMKSKSAAGCCDAFTSVNVTEGAGVRQRIGWASGALSLWRCVWWRWGRYRSWTASINLCMVPFTHFIVRVHLQWTNKPSSQEKHLKKMGNNSPFYQPFFRTKMALYPNPNHSDTQPDPYFISQTCWLHI